MLHVAVVTGGHCFDVLSFHKLFNSFDGMDITIQHIDDFCSSPKAVRESYDVVVFYIMMMDGPKDEGMPWYAGKPATALAELGETRQGIVVLHHAILAYPQWEVWNQLVGIPDRTFGYHGGETVKAQVVAPEHPITKGIGDWTMVDETYTMADAGSDSEVLITYDHPKSMKTIAWTRQYRKSPVFCLEQGHDHLSWNNRSFRMILQRGIMWCTRNPVMDIAGTCSAGAPLACQG